MTTTISQGAVELLGGKPVQAQAVQLWEKGYGETNEPCSTRVPCVVLTKAPLKQHYYLSFGNKNIFGLEAYGL